MLIRAGHNDHTVVADLLAPGGAVALHRPIDRLVANAQTAAQRPSSRRPPISPACRTSSIR